MRMPVARRHGHRRPVRTGKAPEWKLAWLIIVVLWFAAVGGYAIYALPTVDSLASVYSGEKWCDDHPPDSDTEAGKCALATDEHIKFLAVARDEVAGARVAMLSEAAAIWLVPAVLLYGAGLVANFVARRRK